MPRTCELRTRATVAGFCAVALLGGCDGIYVDGGPASQVAFTISIAAEQAFAGGVAEAFDKADRARVRLTRGGATMTDTTLELTAPGAERSVRLTVNVEQETEVWDVLAELRRGSDPLFTGNATATVQRGRSVDIEVTLSPTPSGVRVAEYPAPLTAIGSSIQLEGAVVFATGDTLRGLALTWTSMDPAVASVTPQGLLTATGEGDARVVGAYQALQATAQIQVRPVVDAVEVSPSTFQVYIGTDQRLVALARDANGNVLNRSFDWSSSAPATAAVDASGLVRGLAAGPVTISATADQRTGQAEGTVFDDPVTSVTVDPASVTLQVGQTAQFRATLRNAAGNELQGRNVSWSSSSAQVASIDANGLLTALTGGQTTITATSEGRSGNATANVNAPIILLSASRLDFNVVPGLVPLPQEVSIQNAGTGTLSQLGVSIEYLGGTADWLSRELSSTTAPATMTVSVNASGLTDGEYEANLTVLSTAAGVNAVTIPVRLIVSPEPIPMQPGDLTASASNDTVTLSWSDNSTNETEFRVNRASGDPPGTSSTIATLPANQTTFIDTGTTFDEAYYYFVGACNAAGCAETMLATAQTAPLAPSDLVLTVTDTVNHVVQLTWQDNSRWESIFLIDLGDSTGTLWTQIGSQSPNTTSTEIGLVPNVTQTFRARACNSAGCSAPTNIVSVTFPPAAPRATTLPPTDVHPYQVFLQAHVSAENSGLYNVRFEWNYDCSQSWEDIPIANSASDGYWSVGLVDLYGGTLICYRALAANQYGVSRGDVIQVVTPPATAPSVSADSVTDITGTSAVVWGSFNGNGSDYNVWVYISPDSTFESSVQSSPISENLPTGESRDWFYGWTDLDLGTTYYYRWAVQNGFGIFYSGGSFTTLPFAPPVGAGSTAVESPTLGRVQSGASSEIAPGRRTVRVR
jgi:uncharacterized protein YjdB